MPVRSVRQLVHSFTQRSRDAQRKARAQFAPNREVLENRTVLTLTSSVVGGVLTVSSTFDDRIVISAASGGNVQVDGADPDTGPAAASTITKIQIQGGPGPNLVDDSAIAPSVFTALTSISVNGGGGADVFDVNPLIPGTYDGADGPVSDIIDGVAQHVSFNGGTRELNIDGVVVTLVNSTGPVLDLLQTPIFDVTITPATDAMFTPGTTLGDGVTLIHRVGAPVGFSFLNPSQSLNIAAGGGTSSIAFDGLDPVGRPAHVTLDSGTTGSTTLSFGGTATNATFDVPSRTFTIDGMPITLPHRAAAEQNRLQVRNFTVNLPSGANSVLSDGPVPGSGVSEVTNKSTGQSYTFLNPSNSLTINATGGVSSITYAGLDLVDRPTTTTINGLNATGTFGLAGKARNVAINGADGTATVDGYVVGFSNFHSLHDAIAASDLTLVLPPGSQETLSDSPNPASGFSRISHPNGQFADFLNPTSTLTVNGNGAQSITYAGLDSVGRPATVVLDGGVTEADLILTGAATNLTIDYHTGTATEDGNTIVFFNTANVIDRVKAANLTFVASADTPEVLSDDGTAGNGISKLTAPTLGAFTTFMNPTASLTIRNTHGSPLTYSGLDGRGRPPRVTFVGSGGDDVLRVAVPGRYQNVTYTYGAIPQINIGGSIVHYKGFLGVHDTTNAANRTFVLSSPSTVALSDGMHPNTGVSRLTALPQGTFTDFTNPSQSLNVVGGAANDTLVFNGVDTVGAPKVISFDGGGGRNTFVRAGRAPFSVFRIRHARIVPPRKGG